MFIFEIYGKQVKTKHRVFLKSFLVSVVAHYITIQCSRHILLGNDCCFIWYHNIAVTRYSISSYNPPNKKVSYKVAKLIPATLKGYYDKIHIFPMKPF